MSNLFSAEPLIIERIREKVPDLRTVASVSILQGEQDPAKYTPAAFVYVDDGEIAATISRSVLTELRWIVAVGIANLGDDYNTVAKRAGEYMHPIIEALHGWNPDKTLYVRPLYCAGWTNGEFAPGYAEFHLFFTQTLPVQGIGG